MSREAELERAVDAFIEGRSDYAHFCQVVEQQLARHPEYVVPALERIAALKKSGRISPALHALISHQLDRSSKGDITVSLDVPDTSPGGSRESAEATDTTEATEATGGEAPPVLTNRSTGPATPPGSSASKTPRHTATRASPASAASPPTTGTVLAGRYRLEAMLGRGGMSVVYRAIDLRRHGPADEAARVAIKLLDPGHAGEEHRRALEREAWLLAELSHPGIVRMLDFDRDGEHAFVVMELLSGERLRSRLVRSHPEPLPADEAMRVIRELAQALAYLHERKLVHRDVKPSNVFVTQGGEVRLLDFGLAAPAGEAGLLEEAAPRAWTPLYASPEMLAGLDADPRDDVYSLGCVIYEILAGRHPWGSLPGDQASRRKLRARRPAGMSRSRWQVLRKALAFRAVARQAHAGEFLADFFPPARPRRVMPWVAAAFLAGIIAGVALRGLETDAWIERLAPLIPAIAPRPAVQPTEMPPAAIPLAEIPPAEIPPAETPPAETPPAEGDADAPATSSGSAAGPREAPGQAPDEMPDSAQESGPGDVGADAPDEPPAEDAPGPMPEQDSAAANQPATMPMAFASGRLRIGEGNGAVRVELRRQAASAGTFGVLWRTVDGSARNGVDFVGQSSWQQATASADESSLVLFIPIVDDSVPGPDRDFLVELRQLPGGPPVGTPDRLEVTILDDD